MNISNIIQKLAGNYETRSTTNDTNMVKAPLKSVKIGDELKVQILHLGDDQAVVRLEDGSEISIAGNLPADAEEGTWLNILVADKGEGVPLKAEVLGTVKLAEDLNKQITNILHELNIPDTKENFELVIKMSKNNIPINKDTVSKAYEYVNTMDTDTDNIMFLMKNDVKVTTTSVRAFDSMLTKSDFLETNLRVLIDTLTESINEINESINMNTESSEIQSEAKLVMGEKAVQNIIEQNSFAPVTEAMQTHNQAAQTAGKAVQNDNALNTNNAIQNNEVVNTINILPETNEISETITPQIKNVNLETSNAIQTEEVISNNGVIAAKENVNVQVTTADIIKESENVQKAQIDVNVPKITPEVLESVQQTEDNVQVKTEVTITKDAAVLKEETVVKNPNELEQTQSLKPVTPLEQKEKLERLREEVVGLFREVKNSKELGEEISQKRIYKSFKDVILDIEENKEVFTRKTSETLTKEVTRMKENISLVSDLNKYNTIVHIPLMINDNKSLAELYVFNGDKENHGKKINENNATMFLSLGTANMGQIESYIKIVNKTIECNFMSESKLGVQVINENKDHLASLLDAYGYTLIKANADIYNGKSLNIFEAIEKNKKDEAKKGFDARA